MIHLITGEVNSGKTAALLSICQSLRGNAEGFVILKEYQSGQFVGQKALDLLTGNMTPFSYLEEYLPLRQTPCLSFGRFRFLEEGLLAADGSIRKAQLHRARHVFADEFGPLELRGQGLWPTYRRLMDHLDDTTDVYMAVRSACVDACVERLGLQWGQIVMIYTPVIGS